MTSVAELRAHIRASGREQLRELALDAARDVAINRGWSAVRMGALAAAIGTSRQTLHTEFGTKDELGKALVMREVSAFFDGVTAQLASHPGDLGAAVSSAVIFTLTSAAENPMLQTILTGGAGGDDSLLPLLTTRGEAVLAGAVDLFADWVARQWPDRDDEAARVMVESVARLLISHVLLASGTPQQAAQDLARVACRCMGFPDRQL
ncbi:MAG TPA: TetR family transcriptional regulator [Mycobacterium sp.]|nr:TetR family transcriptional regulator [Mycobacterium sp.]